MPIEYDGSITTSNSGSTDTNTGYRHYTLSEMRAHNEALSGVWADSVWGNSPYSCGTPEPIIQTDMEDEVGSIDNVQTTDDNPMGMSPSELENNLARARSIINGETNFGIRFNNYFDTFEIEEQYADDEDEHDD